MTKCGETLETHFQNQYKVIFFSTLQKNPCCLLLNLVKECWAIGQASLVFTTGVYFCHILFHSSSPCKSYFFSPRWIRILVITSRLINPRWLQWHYNEHHPCHLLPKSTPTPGHPPHTWLLTSPTPSLLRLTVGIYHMSPHHQKVVVSDGQFNKMQKNIQDIHYYPMLTYIL